MICNQAREKLQALADGELPAAERGEVETHVASCAACGREAALVRGNVAFLSSRLRLLRDSVRIDLSFLDSVPAAAPPPAEKPRPKTPGPARTSPRIPVWLPILGILLLLGAAGWFALRDRREPQPPTDLADAPGPAAGQPETPAKPGPVAPPPRGDAPPVRPDGTVPPVRPQPAIQGVMELLSRLVQSPSNAVLGQMWTALRARPADSKALLDALPAAKTEDDRAAIVLALAGAPGAPGVSSRLQDLLGRDESTLVRSAAAAALALADGAPGRVSVGRFSIPVGPIADADRRAVLASALSAESDPAVLGTLIRVLGPSQAEDEEITRRFVAIARGEDAELRSAAIDAIRLGKPRDPGTILSLVLDTALPAEVRAGLVDPAVGPDPAEAYGRLRDIYSRAEEEPVKLAAVQTLVRVKEEDRLALAAEVLRGDSSHQLRSAALGIVMGVRTEAALAILRERMDGESDPGLQALAKEAWERLSEQLNR